MSPLLASFITPILKDHAVLTIGVAIVVVILSIFGISDIARFRFRRVWAISGVCFSESIRRKVLWLVPLAVLGLIAVVQLQQPLDALDSMRQTTKFCLLTTGLVVITSTIILACTNLPREIENKVIFTVVTKPTTRLEIVLGKVVGFTRMSGTILLMMAIFCFGYLHLRAWLLERDLQTKLDNNSVEAISRPTFEHYVHDHLLSAKQLATPTGMNVFAIEPDFKTHKRSPVATGTVLVKFVLPSNMLAYQDPDGTKTKNSLGMEIRVHAQYEPLPSYVLPDRNGLAKQPPAFTIEIRDDQRFMAIGREINGGAPFLIPPENNIIEQEKQHITANNNPPIKVDVPSPYVANLQKFPYIYVALTPSLGDHRLWVNDDPSVPPVTLLVPIVNKDGTVGQTVLGPAVDGDGQNITEYYGPDGNIGQKLAGDRTGNGQVAVYRFRNSDIHSDGQATVPIEFKIGVEKSGESNDLDVMTQAQLVFVNQKTGYRSPPMTVFPENNRVSYGSAPVQAFDGKDFNVEVRCLTPGQWLNVTALHSLSVVKSVDSFAFNLFKANLILWLLSILVVTIAIFCSTFLSWPIAVVLTIVILLGRWTLNELGDAATAGIGRTISTEFGVKDPDVAKTVSDSVEHLNSTLKIVTQGFPDISQFPATDDIEQGISIKPETLLGGLEMLLGFGLPLTVLAYVRFKMMEVAP